MFVLFLRSVPSQHDHCARDRCTID
jgi:hypothetical protein